MALEARVACQDVSDGLRATIDTVHERSQVGIRIEETSLPIPPCVVRVAERVGVSPTGLALSASVDFELVFTLPADVADGQKRVDLGEVTEIGVCTTDKECFLAAASGSTGALPGVPWLNQDRDVVSLILDGLKP
jgi:thiamine-monophosphate kinase